MELQKRKMELAQSKTYLDEPTFSLHGFETRLNLQLEKNAFTLNFCKKGNKKNGA